MSSLEIRTWLGYTHYALDPVVSSRCTRTLQYGRLSCKGDLGAVNLVYYEANHELSTISDAFPQTVFLLNLGCFRLNSAEYFIQTAHIASH